MHCCDGLRSRRCRGPGMVVQCVREEISLDIFHFLVKLNCVHYCHLRDGTRTMPGELVISNSALGLEYQPNGQWGMTRYTYLGYHPLNYYGSDLRSRWSTRPPRKTFLHCTLHGFNLRREIDPSTHGCESFSTEE